jgi:hypothetical protein
MTEQLYHQVVTIAEEYLGPAADRFITRQITFHFDKPPQELTAADIPKLVEWTKVTLGLITEDRQVVEEFTRKMAALANH